MNDYEYNNFKFTSIVYLTDDILDLKANKETSSFDHISSNKLNCLMSLKSMIFHPIF